MVPWLAVLARLLILEHLSPTGSFCSLQHVVTRKAMAGHNILHTAGLSSLKIQHPIIPVNTIFMFGIQEAEKRLYSEKICGSPLHEQAYTMLSSSTLLK